MNESGLLDDFKDAALDGKTCSLERPQIWTLELRGKKGEDIQSKWSLKH